jgi:hypothetical protein
MARYIREVKDYNGTLLSREESSNPFPRVTECSDWYQPGLGRLVIRHIRQLHGREDAEPTIKTIVTVGPPFVLPSSDRIGHGLLRARAS